MKTLENNAELLQDLSIDEMENVNGGWNWRTAVGVAAVSCLCSEAALVGFLVTGLMAD
ncbi:MAG: hypothetical protein H6Q13_2378 [Bacteroidetes bacterium]|nr:hypothetical protein [Bacteroidota bacterium]